MRSAPRLVTMVLVALFALLPSAAQASQSVFAFVEAETEDPGDEAPMFEPGMEPAVQTPPVVEEEREEPWTARYIAPLLLVGVIVVAAGYFFTYGARVRGKYEVVD